MKNMDVVILWVKDTGCGIEKEEMDRVFDPFFTTKEVGRGTGLGLSVVHGIVVNHGGDVQLASILDKGTTVRIFLPSLSSGMGKESMHLKPAATVAPGTNVLFVDDEEDITTIGLAMLEKQGYQVTAMSDSRKALLEIQSRPNDFDLIITDLTMPHITGLQLAAAVANIREDLPVVLITGMGDQIMKDCQGLPHIKGIIHKPFGIEALQQTIAEVMSNNPSGES